MTTTTTRGGSILLVEDDEAIASSLRRLLGRAGYRVEHCARGDEGAAQAREGKFDLVLSDLKLPGLSGLDLAAQLRAARPLLPVIVLTAHGTTETAIVATRLGAYDYLLKPFAPDELLALVAKAIATSRLASEPVLLGASAAPSGEALVGQSRAMQGLYKEIGRVAARPVSVLIRGETGTGKELIARAIHQHSDRAGQPFIAVNCAAIPAPLMESELFGHERGAFTGAETRRIGRFEQAHGGTIFLDEIGELDPATQIKLLRVLQERSIVRLGGRENLPLDLRIVAATHLDLEAAIAAKRFREDLYYRLSVVEIRVPALRDRAEDIPQLTQYFLRRYAADLGTPHLSILPEALAFFEQQPWPGNVRELENAVRKAILLARGQIIGLDEARATLRAPDRATAERLPLAEFIAEVLQAAEQTETGDALRQIVQAAEREACAQAMQRAGGNLTHAARWLGITRVTLREKLTALGLRTSAAPDAE